MPDVLLRARNRFLRSTGSMAMKKPLDCPISEPIISFTFDDFPRSALHTGGAILERYSAAGTFFACSGLMGTVDASGEMFIEDDMRDLLARGHELGCHTGGHHNAMLTKPSVFAASIVQNREALSSLFPAEIIRSFSYPKAEPNFATKRVAASYAMCCRGGGQTLNAGRADLNCLKSFFLEQSRDCPERIMRLIDECVAAPGWLIFSTHDVCDAPSPYGCTPALFEEIVRYAAHSGARLLPMGQACQRLMARQA